MGFSKGISKFELRGVAKQVRDREGGFKKQAEQLARGRFDGSQYEVSELLEHCTGGAVINANHKGYAHTEGRATKCNSRHKHPLCLLVRYKGYEDKAPEWERADAMVGAGWAYREENKELIEKYTQLHKIDHTVTMQTLPDCGDSDEQADTEFSASDSGDEDEQFEDEYELGGDEVDSESGVD